MLEHSPPAVTHQDHVKQTVPEEYGLVKIAVQKCCKEVDSLLAAFGKTKVILFEDLRTQIQISRKTRALAALENYISACLAAFAHSQDHHQLPCRQVVLKSPGCSETFCYGEVESCFTSYELLLELGEIVRLTSEALYGMQECLALIETLNDPESSQTLLNQIKTSIQAHTSTYSATIEKLKIKNKTVLSEDDISVIEKLKVTLLSCVQAIHPEGKLTAVDEPPGQRRKSIQP